MTLEGIWGLIEIQVMDEKQNEEAREQRTKSENIITYLEGKKEVSRQGVGRHCCFTDNQSVILWHLYIYKWLRSYYASGTRVAFYTYLVPQTSVHNRYFYLCVIHRDEGWGILNNLSKIQELISNEISKRTSVWFQSFGSMSSLPFFVAFQQEENLKIEKMF